MTLALHYALRSDVGLLREGNEDSAYAGPHLLAIADGMGGHAAGEVASAVAISALQPLDSPVMPEDMLGALAAAVTTAATTLQEMSRADPAVEGMGTTLTALFWSGDDEARVGLCHIGDSRAYLLREGDLFQITRDHTLVQSLVDEGRLTPEAAATHPQRSLVVRALQTSVDSDPDLAMMQAQPGDRFLLCSDGLTDVVSEQTVHKVLADVSDPDRAVRRLIDLANGGGGPDNITCIVADAIDTVTGTVPASTKVIFAGAADPAASPRPPLDGRRSGIARRGVARTRTATVSGGNGASGGSDTDLEAADGTEQRTGRRRWPLVTSLLAVLILVIAGGAFAAWRYTQSQYYVAADGTEVVIYRGVDQSVLGLSLSSVYQRTGIPLTHVAAGDRQQFPITGNGSLADAKRTVLHIKRAWTCKQAQARVAYWAAHKPKPVKKKVRVNGKKVTKTVTPPYKPKPTVPAYCDSVGT